MIGQCKNNDQQYYINVTMYESSWVKLVKKLINYFDHEKHVEESLYWLTWATCSLFYNTSKADILYCYVKIVQNTAQGLWP